MFFNVLSCVAIHLGLSGCGFFLFILSGWNGFADWARILFIAVATLLVCLLYFLVGITFEKGEKQWQKELSALPLSAMILLLCVLSQAFDWKFLNEGLFLSAPLLPLWTLFDQWGLSVATSSLILACVPSIFIWVGVKCQKTALHRWFRR